MIKLKSFCIKTPFKNIKNLTVNFERCNGVTVLIGNNGSGKSNFIEALSSVFAGLYDKKEFKPSFSYTLEYTKNEKTVKIEYDHKKTKNQYTPYRSDDLPDKIIANYSGEDLRIWDDYYFDFYDKYMKRVIKGYISYNESKEMLFINKYHWNIALLTMVVFEIDCSDIIGDKIIEKISFEISDKNKGNIERFDSNYVVDFAKKINELEKKDGKTIELTIDEFKGETPMGKIPLFNLLSICLLPKEPTWKLMDSMKLTFKEGYTADELSEGEKKQILIKFITRIYANNDCILLLDEPDAHTHISNKKKIKDLLYNSETEKKQVYADCVLTTHSPTLTMCFENENVYMFKTEQGEVHLIDKQTQEIVSEITSDFMNAQEQNILLGCSEPIILLVEGDTDKKHINNAYNKLKDEYKDLSFRIFSLQGAGNIVPFMRGLYETGNNNNKVYIGIFDNDKAGKGSCKDMDPCKGMDGEDRKEFYKLKKNQTENKHFYAFLLPKPDSNKEDDYLIESLLPNEKFIKALETAVGKRKGNSINKIFSNKIFCDIKKDTKNILAKNSSTFGKEDFSKFKNLFDLIKEIYEESKKEQKISK